MEKRKKYIRRIWEMPDNYFLKYQQSKYKFECLKRIEWIGNNYFVGTYEAYFCLDSLSGIFPSVFLEQNERRRVTEALEAHSVKKRVWRFFFLFLFRLLKRMKIWRVFFLFFFFFNYWENENLLLQLKGRCFNDLLLNCWV